MGGALRRGWACRDEAVPAGPGRRPPHPRAAPPRFRASPPQHAVRADVPPSLGYLSAVY